MPSRNRAANQVRWIPAVNQSATECPGFGVCQINGFGRNQESNDTLDFFRPSSSCLLPHRVVVNGPTPMAANSLGLPLRGGRGAVTRDWPALAKVNGTVLAGDRLHTVADQWYLEKDSGPPCESVLLYPYLRSFKALSDSNSDGVALVGPTPHSTSPILFPTLSVVLASDDCAFFDGMAFDIPFIGLAFVDCLYYAAIFNPAVQSPGCACDPSVEYVFAYYYKPNVGHRATLMLNAPYTSDTCGGLGDTTADARSLLWPGPATTDFEATNLDWADPVLLDLDTTHTPDYCCGVAVASTNTVHATVFVQHPP